MPVLKYMAGFNYQLSKFYQLIVFPAPDGNICVALH